MSDGTSFDDIRPGEERSTLRLIQRAILNNWDIKPEMREALPKVVANILLRGSSDHAKMRAVEAFLTMDRDNNEKLFRLLKVEAEASIIGMNAAGAAGEARSDIEEVLMVRIQRLRKENPDARDTLERVVAAGMRRLGLPAGDAAGDGAAAPRPGD